MALPAPRADGTCVVTGASSGIGAEIARRLAARGYGLTLVARRADRLQQLATELAPAGSPRVEVAAADLTEPGARAELVDEVGRRGLEIDVLVNNAGFSTTGPVRRADRQREVALVRTDVEAVVDLCTLVVPGLAERGRGAILNVASTAAFQPLPGQAAYSAAKAFVLGYSQALRAELAGTGVQVTALCPGPVDTEFFDAAGFSQHERDAMLPRFMWLDPDQVAVAALDGLDHDRAVVIPGLMNRISARGAYLAPRSVLLPILRRFYPLMRDRA
ncbi:MAG TPA: SDR family oxidoreductase [Acidimicrobiales bacterium]|nr:SDR family oxidoreductase [Acidimicrobiales bacterium]